MRLRLLPMGIQNIVKLLLNAGANADPRDCKEYPLSYALNAKQIEFIVQVIARNPRQGSYVRVLCR